MLVQAEITLTKEQRTTVMMEELSLLLDHLKKNNIHPVTKPKSKSTKTANPNVELSMIEASTAMGVSYDKVRKYVRDGDIPHYKKGASYKFNLHKILAWQNNKDSKPHDVFLGEQWVLCKAVNFYPGKEDRDQETIEIVLKPYWHQDLTIKKTIPYDCKFIVVDIITNLNNKGHVLAGELCSYYDKYSYIKSLMTSKEVKVEIAESNNPKFPYNAMTPFDFRERRFEDTLI